MMDLFELEFLFVDDDLIRGALVDVELCVLVVACAHVIGDLLLLWFLL